MSKYLFNLGDVVVLKSGGPAMTVSYQVAQEKYHQSLQVECHWFLNGDLKCSTFCEDALAPVNGFDTSKPDGWERLPAKKYEVA